MAEKNNAGFSDELLKFIDDWKAKPGNLIMILHKVQEEQGYISKEAAAEVAKLTGTQPRLTGKHFSADHSTRSWKPPPTFPS